jgi:hypothetical protein
MLWVLYDYCEMLEFLKEAMSVIDFNVYALVIDSANLDFYDDSL